jgi:hypothetical protein
MLEIPAAIQCGTDRLLTIVSSYLHKKPNRGFRPSRQAIEWELWKGKRQKAKGKRQKAKGKRQKAEGRRSTAINPVPLFNRVEHYNLIA